MRTMLLKHSAACDTWPVGGGRTFCPSPSCTQRWTRPPPAYSGQQDSSGAIHTLRNNIFRATQCRGSPDTHQHSVTLTTQCSLDRWPRFIQQAKSWGGPVSVAVYIPAPQHTAAANAALEIVQHWAAEYVAQHPTQQLHVTTLCANHYAREGASVLSHTGHAASEAQADAASTAAPKGSSPSSDSAGTGGSIPYDQLYPINALRNLALQQATTPLVLPVDADFVFSEGLERQLHSPCHSYNILSEAQQPAAAVEPGSRARSAAAGCSGESKAFTVEAMQEGRESLSLSDQLLLSQQHQPQSPLMLLLPAFQLVPQQHGLPHDSHLQRQQQQQQHSSGKQAKQLYIPDNQQVHVPRTKPELLQALQNGSVRPFDCGVFAPQQQPLDVAAWCSAQQPLELQYVDLFEVHGGIALKAQLPPYSEAFRGYGLNKQQHAWHAAALGFRFKVLPDAFMVTVPHKRSSSWRPQPGTSADAAHLQRISRVYEQFKQQLVQGLSPAKD